MPFLGGCIITPSLWVPMMLWFGWRQKMVIFQSSPTPWQVGEWSLSLIV